jgi:hypothetical protein
MHAVNSRPCVLAPDRVPRDHPAHDERWQPPRFRRGRPRAVPRLLSFVEWGIDAQLADVGDLLRLPMPEAGLASGQSFAATACVVNLIAGASVWFHDASTVGLSDRDDRGRRYRETGVPPIRRTGSGFRGQGLMLMISEGGCEPRSGEARSLRRRVVFSNGTSGTARPAPPPTLVGRKIGPKLDRGSGALPSKSKGKPHRSGAF